MFVGHATIAGHQQFLTFDRKFYEYAGSCSYVLAQDTINNLFKVIVNYDRSRGEKSITVEVDGHNVKVSPEFKVCIHNKYPVIVTPIPYKYLVEILKSYFELLIDSFDSS